MQQSSEMVDVSLKTPNTPEERQQQIGGNVRLARGENAVPFMDYDDEGNEYEGGAVEETAQRRQVQRSAWPPARVDDGKPHLRYFCVGPSTYQIRCPLCKQRADTETVQMSGALGQLSCVLSTLSCCFPIFSLSFVYVCLQSRLKSKRIFCNKCGGHLGFYWRPT